MSKHPLGEVFGFPPDNFSERAQHYRKDRLCPYNNRVPSCTKDKVDNPLGVCSLLVEEGPTVICPVRFRQEWLITSDAARFFFPPGTKWTSLKEVRLCDANGNAAGNLDVVLVAYDDSGKVTDFGALEVQSVYISGNIRRPFEYYMADPPNRYNMDWSGKKLYPRPDYLSSSRKRLAPQLIYKGLIVNHWGKKIAVAVHRAFFSTLPSLPQTPQQDADVIWLVYGLDHDSGANVYNLALEQEVYTRFKPALDKITRPEPGPLDAFMGVLQEELDKVLEEDLSSEESQPTLFDLLKG